MKVSIKRVVTAQYLQDLPLLCIRQLQCVFPSPPLSMLKSMVPIRAKAAELIKGRTVIVSITRTSSIPSSLTLLVLKMRIETLERRENEKMK